MQDPLVPPMCAAQGGDEGRAAAAEIQSQASRPLRAEHRPDGPVELANKKLAALLAYLACSAPEPRSREKLATLLWGSRVETQAQQNLRQALFRLRRALGPDAVMSDGDEVWLAPGVIDCDVARLKALSRRR